MQHGYSYLGGKVWGASLHCASAALESSSYTVGLQPGVQSRFVHQPEFVVSSVVLLALGEC